MSLGETFRFLPITSLTLKRCQQRDRVQMHRIKSTPSSRNVSHISHFDLVDGLTKVHIVHAQLSASIPLLVQLASVG